MQNISYKRQSNTQELNRCIRNINKSLTRIWTRIIQNIRVLFWLQNSMLVVFNRITFEPLFGSRTVSTLLWSLRPLVSDVGKIRVVYLYNEINIFDEGAFRRGFPRNTSMADADWFILILGKFIVWWPSSIFSISTCYFSCQSWKIYPRGVCDFRPIQDIFLNISLTIMCKLWIVYFNT